MKRFCKLLTAALLLCLLAVLPLAAHADEGDYDSIEEYLITVELRPDGSADITYEIDWQVLAGEEDEYLSWVKIGLANRYADGLTALTPTISRISLLEEGGVFAKVQFGSRYYSPAVCAKNGGQSRVRFAFTVHQSHLFTRNDDGTASFAFTPGWFDDLVVQRMVVRWKNGEGFVADNTGTDGEYLTWEFGPLGHGQGGTVHVTVPVTNAGGFAEENALTAADVPGAEDDGMDEVVFLLVFLLMMLIFVAMIVLLIMRRCAPWGGGFGEDIDPDDWYWYSNGSETVRLARTLPPPKGYHKVDPPAQFRAGGGKTRGGGTGRSENHSSCACVSGCACASSCACACACAGGGRAGCSAKDIYKVTFKTKETPHEP